MKHITEDKGRIRPVIEGDFQYDENGNITNKLSEGESRFFKPRYKEKMLF